MPLRETLDLLRTIPLTVVCLFAACDNPQGPEDLRAPADLIESQPSASNLSPTASLLTLEVDDPVADPTGPIDVTRMQMDFDPVTGDYEIRLDTHPSDPFAGVFRVNINLLNVDEGVPFSDAGNDYDLATGTTTLILSGNSAQLSDWASGQMVTTNSLCNRAPDPRFFCSTHDVPNPPGVSLFRSAVGNFEGFLANEDVIAFADYSQAAVIQELTAQQRLLRLGDDVLDLVDASILSEGQADGLSDKLTGVALKLLAGRERPAIQQLRAFIRQVRGFVPHHLTPGQGEALIEQAEALIVQIQS